MPRSRIVGNLVVVFVTLAVLRPILFSPGVPALRHDWAWPITQGGVAALIHNLSAPIIPANWDTIAWIPRVQLVQPIVLLFAGLTSPVFCLKLLLFAVIATAASGGFLLARALGSSTPIAALCALWLSATPFVIDELVAGHIWILLAYAALVHALNAIIRRNPWPVTFLWSAATAIDIHFIGFDTIAFAVLLVTKTVTLRELRGALLGLVAFVPGIFGGIMAAASATFESQQTIAMYERVNSVPLLDALRGFGYSAGYDRVGTFALAQWLLFLPVAFAIASALKRRALAIVLLVVSCFAAAGIYGPVGQIQSWAFDSIRATSVFRELFDFIALVNIAAVVAFASLRIPRTLQVAAVSLGVIAILPGLRASYAPLLPLFVPARADVEAVTRVERETGSMQILALPALAPMMTNGFPGGVDPLGDTIGTHGLLGSEHGLPAPVRAGLSQTDMRHWFERLHTGTLIERPGWQSVARYQLEPSFAQPPQPLIAPSRESWRVSALAASERVRLGAAVVCAPSYYQSATNKVTTFASDDPPCQPVRLAWSKTDVPYPSHGWSDYDAFWFLAPQASAAAPGARFTTSAGKAFPIPNGCDARERYSYDTFELVGGTWRAITRALVHCSAPRTTRATVVAGVRRDDVMPRLYKGGGTVSVDIDLPWVVSARFAANSAAMITLLSQYSPWWTAVNVEGSPIGEHHVVLGYFNGWLMSRPGTARIVFLYWPAIPILIIESLIAVLYAYAVVHLVVLRLRGRGDVPISRK